MAALSEINTSWKKVHPHDRLRERTWGWFSALHISNAYAYNFPASSAHLAGGTAVFTLNNATHQVTDKTQDTLGRWSSTRIQGAQSKALRLIAAYRCVRNLHGPLSVWNQQRYLLDLDKISKDPIEKFDEDLFTFIAQCLEKGEHVVLGIDINEDVRVGVFAEKMRSLGLLDVCIQRHGPNGPPTYSRGSTPIDALFVSPSLLGSQCGYLPVFCDHRILWMDIDVQAILGRDIPMASIRTPQRLTLSDPRVVQKYTMELTKLMQESNLLERLQALQKDIQSSPTTTQLNLYNELDDIRLRNIQIANKRCRHIKLGQVPFSPRLVLAWHKLKAWQLLLKRLKGGRVNSRYLHRVLKQAKIKDITLLTLSEVEDNLAETWSHYRRLKNEAPQLRATWVEEVASARAAEGKTSLAQELRNLLIREQQRKDARLIKQAMSGNQRKGLSAIEIMNEEGNWIEVTDQQNIETELLKELACRFNQAAETPFQMEPLLSDIGNLGTTEMSQKILKGTYQTPVQTDEWAKKLIPFLAQVIPTEEPIDVTPEQYRQGWKKVKEKTSAGPSGITIPQMKAHGTSDYLTEVDTIMANLPYRFGFSPLRWRKGLDVMLEKKPGARQLSKLRAILLYEADFNQNNKRLGREMLYRAENARAVAVEQYGSRKNMSATDQSLNKALTFDIWRQLRQRGALCSNDAKGCYDRIVHNCASLCLQRIGTRMQPIVSMFETIQKLEHHVRTIFGESKGSFVQSGSTPLQGVGQGNGAGPQIWALVSTPILNMLRDYDLGATFQAAISQASTTLVGFAFVDDTDLITSGPNMTLEEVLDRIQKSLTAWEGGIRATGGAIEPLKSHWYLVDFDWKNGIPSYKSVSQTGGELRVRDPNGRIQSLKQLQPWEAERTLGVRLAPDGNMEAQFKWMADAAQSWTDRLRSGHLPRQLTWLAWNTTILKTLEYPLPTTTLTRSQCNKLTSIIAKEALPRCGIMRSFPRDILHAPLKAGGLNIPNLYVEQGIAHLIRLVRYSQSRIHSTAILLRQSCEALKLELGTNGALLSNPRELLHLATDCWIKSTWQFALEYGIVIKDNIPDFLSSRSCDRLLIPTFANMGYRGSELRQLNQCRIFLRVTWLGDIVTADGEYIERHAMEPPYEIHKRDIFHYPDQVAPPPSSWNVWSRALTKLCTNGRRLKHRLGTWIRTKEVSWWYDATWDCLYYVRTTNNVECFSKMKGNRTRAMNSRYRRSTIVTEIPTTCTPATAYRRHDIAYLTGKGLLDQRPVHQNDPLQWILQSVAFPNNLEEELVQSGGCINAVSDGSFKELFGTAAWTLHITDQCVIQGQCTSPGEPEDQSAYRSELTGIYGIVSTIWTLQHKWSCVGEVTVGCDGLSALRQAQKTTDFIDPNVPQFDLIMAIRTIIAQTNWKWNWIHVKGHQDAVNELSQLDRWSKWNVQMDTLAKQEWTSARHKYIDPDIFGEPWRVEVGGKKITSNMRGQLREACNMPSAMNYWDGKLRFGSRTSADIDWDALGTAMAGIPLNRRHWRSKTTTGFCATGRMMYRRKEHETDECPRCGAPENVEHIWKCEKDTQELWNKAMQGVREWLVSYRTHPELARSIIQGIESWRNNTSTGAESSIPWVRDIVNKQNECGWRNFFEGMILKDWQQVMNRQLTRVRSRKSSKRWVVALIRKMWQVAWDLWEHRNGYLHDREESFLSTQTNNGIKHQFELGCRNLDKATQVLFRGGLQTTIQKPLEVRQQWLKRVQVARDRSELQSAYTAERRLMAQWLNPNTS